MNDNQSLLQFIRQHRGDEANFNILYDHLLGNKAGAAPLQVLGEEGEKLATVYKTAKEKRGTAWPEFEHFVSYYEKGLISS